MNDHATYNWRATLRRGRLILFALLLTTACSTTGPRVIEVSSRTRLQDVAACGRDIRGLKVAYSPDLDVFPVEASVAAAVEAGMSAVALERFDNEGVESVEKRIVIIQMVRHGCSQLTAIRIRPSPCVCISLDHVPQQKRERGNLSGRLSSLRE